MIIKNVVCLIRKITITDGRKRVHDTRYSGVVDDTGNFKLTGYCGHIYHEPVVVANNTTDNRNMKLRISKDIA